MELSLIVSRLAELLPIVDNKTTTQRASRSGSGDYIPCVGTIWEDDFTKEVISEWSSMYPSELPGFSDKWIEVKYPNKRGNCDLCIRSNDYNPVLGEPPYEWAIEMKYVRFIGDNGKNNDYGVTKVASPYRKDRSSVLDAERLVDFTLAKRKAIVMYGFEFDSASYDHAISWCDNNSTGSEKLKNIERSNNMKKILHTEDPDLNQMSMLSLIPLFEAASKTRKIQLSECSYFEFNDLSKHPLYRMGRIIAWEVL